MDRDAHALDHHDDVVDLLGVGQLDQVIRHFGVGQVSLFLAEGDQFLDLALLVSGFAHVFNLLEAGGGKPAGNR